MKPARFDYAQPQTVSEALAMLAERGDAARVLAGGQSLAPMLNMRLVTPAVLVDITAIDELRTVQINGGAIEVGAAVTQHALHVWPDLERSQPLLAQLLPWVGHYATRQRGTVCGSVVHADPSSELPLALALLEGEVVIGSPSGRRVIVAADFQCGPLQTALGPEDLVVSVRFPLARPGTVTRFREVSQRHGDFAIVAVAAVGDGEGVRLGVGGVADVPAVETFPWAEQSALEDALNAFAWRLGACDDAHASARYRRELVRRIGYRVIEETRDALSGR